MDDDATLMAYLVPKLTSHVEDAATDALAYVLNKSATSRDALNSLLREGGFAIPPITRFETQVTYEDGSRPDMTGYDENDVNRLLVESKFWATLSKDQASSYFNLLDQSSPAVLLFIALNGRFETLWVEIVRQITEENPGTELAPVGSSDDWRSAMVAGAEKRLALVSWVRLLDSMADKAGDAGVKADIRQLRGLAQGQDAEAFLPMHSGELNPASARRLVGYTKLVEDVVHSRGVPQGWMNTNNLSASGYKYGYGRYFRLTGVSPDILCWFGVSYDRWAQYGDTPLWLVVYRGQQIAMDGIVMKEIGKRLNVQARDGWVPIYPKLGVEYSEVLDDVASRLKAIAEIVGAHLPAE